MQFIFDSMSAVLRTFAVIIGILFLLGFILYLTTEDKGVENGKPSSDSKSGSESDTAYFVQIDSFSKDDSVRLNQLLSKFNLEEDEFTKAGWYHHKTFGNGWPSRTTLYTNVNTDGYIYLSSVYHEEDWLFHEGVSVKVDSTVLNSDLISRTSENSKTQVVTGGIYEVVSYLRDADNGIINLIANNPTKKILVRYHGNEFIRDVTLRKLDAQAIKDCYDLSTLLKKKHSPMQLK